MGSESADSLARRVARGTLWVTASTILLKAGNVVVIAVVARILTPDDFGVFAIAIAVYAVVSSLADLGMGAAIVRSPGEPDDIAPTVTTLALLIGGATAAALALGADPLADYLGSPAAAGPVRILALCIVINIVIVVPIAQLGREMRQKRVFWANVISFVPANLALVALAAGGSGASAFAWSRVVAAAVVGIVVMMSVSRRYRPGLRPGLVRGLVLFGLPLALANLVNYSLLNADYLIIARILTDAEVGTYMLAFTIAGWSTAVLGTVLNTMVVPALAQQTYGGRSMRPAIVSAARWIALVSLPIGAVTFALARPLVVTVYGSRWAAAAPVLEVLVVYGVMYVFSLFAANVLIAGARTGMLLVVQLVWLAVLASTMVWSVRFGLVGVAWAHVATMAVVVLPAYWASIRREDRPAARELVASVAPAAAAAGLAMLVAVGARAALPGDASALLVGGLLSVVVYVVLLTGPFAGMLPLELVTRVPAPLARLGDATTVGLRRLAQHTARPEEPLPRVVLNHQGRTE